MHLLASLVGLIAISCAAPAASAPKVVEAPAAPKVRQLRERLAKVLEHASGLPSALTSEARQVDEHAARALRGSSVADEAGLEKVLAEFSQFTAHLTGRSDELQHEAATHLPEGALEKAKAMVPGLESKLRKVVAHMKADKGPETPDHAAVIATMERALATVSGQNAFERAVSLHNALKSAHDFLAKRTQELAADRERLNGEIEEQSAYILFMMLRQRRKLPMKAQVALLKRHQFRDCSYAKKLLDHHADSRPLDEQLLAMVPHDLAEKLAKKVARGNAGNLAAAGSDGRVQIVSSRMKNAVQAMADGLAKAKPQLEEIMNGPSVSPEEKKQAKEILAGLDVILKKVSSTHDLKSQMDAMDDMQNKLKAWMLNAAKMQK
jgi:hypothetical protein